MDRQLDASLIAEVERLGTNDIHDAKAAICMYVNYSRWLTKPPKRGYSSDDINRGFDKWERILRSFVAHRKSGDLRSVDDIKKELFGDKV